MQPMRQIHEITSILRDLRRIVRVLRTSSRASEQRLGVSGAQLFVLNVLSSSGVLSLNDLAARTHTHQSTVSVVVKKLVARGLVRRSASERDGRRLELTLTPSGRALLKKAPMAAQERLIEGVQRMAARDRAALAVALGRLVVAMQLTGEEPEMFFEEDGGRVPRRARRG
jgi:DNA-binding MarR family transcriptional regulator